ncbi:unnamed protein product [Rotaria sp. Silwood1]|nr:unnamed protein product [Rotaria sp. Silwood1]CAF5116577.1 unnamed protein product [Rotaria sp. Silwood1]
MGAFERRRLIDYHPYGPEIQSTEVKQEENRSKSLIELCRNAPDQHMILRDLFLQSLLNTMTEDELLALAIQRSIEDQDDLSPVLNILARLAQKSIRFNELCLILNSSLQNIVDRWFNGQRLFASQFTALEIKQLIRAIFQTSEGQTAALGKIQ